MLRYFFFFFKSETTNSIPLLWKEHTIFFTPFVKQKVLCFPHESLNKKLLVQGNKTAAILENSFFIPDNNIPDCFVLKMYDVSVGIFNFDIFVTFHIIKFPPDLLGFFEGKQNIGQYLVGKMTISMEIVKLFFYYRKTNHENYVNVRHTSLLKRERECN